MTVTLNPPALCFAGEPLVFTFQLTAGGVPTNPSAGYFSYGVPANNSPVVVPLASLTNTGPGVYTYLLDTTNLAANLYVAEIVATGSVWSVDIELFIIQARPLG